MPFKIAFVTPGYDPCDVRRGSGTFYYLAQELIRQGCQLHFIGPLVVHDPFPTRFFRMVTRQIYKGRYPTYLDPWVARARCKKLSKELIGLEYDLVLTNDHGIAAENLTSKPVIIFTDVMISPAHSGRFAKPFTPLYRTPVVISAFFQQTIRKSLERSALCVFPSEWQKTEAMQYGISPSKLALIPFGANIPDPGLDVANNRDFRVVGQTRRLDLLFVGKDWQRKGGPLAVKITERLREIGIDASLHVVGAKLMDLPTYVINYGILDKNNIDDWARLDTLYRDCNIFLFPSLSEGSAIVPREAAAYGLPTLAFRIDGLVGAVEEGVNGILLDLSSTVDDFVRVIQNWINHPDEYHLLSISARQFYESNANWPAIVAILMEKIGEVLCK